jgi:serine/threonine protein kinase/Tol biopolymer transport system component
LALAPGTRLGAYEILSLIGSGGMGEVYRARDTRLDRTVAIKVLPPQLAADPQLRDRFDREARAISSLNHPHICVLHDIGRDGDVDFLVLELLDGQTLADRLRAGPLSVDEALRYAIQICDALDKAHRSGIVHRDLKPANVMLTKAGAKLLDFGLAKPTSPVMAASGLSMLPTTPPGLTAQGTIVGTFQYMAPEQIEGFEADARTDIFAFGAVVFEMMTGRPAFEGKTRAALLGAILKDTPPRVSAVQPLSPPALDRLVATCLEKDPDDRYQSARDLLREVKWASETPAQSEQRHALEPHDSRHRRCADRRPCRHERHCGATLPRNGKGARVDSVRNHCAARRVIRGHERGRRHGHSFAVGHVSRWAPGGVCRERRHGLVPVAAPVGQSDRSTAGWNRSGRIPVLVARCEVHRLLRQWQVEEGTGRRWPRGDAVRCRIGPGRRVGTGQRDRVRRSPRLRITTRRRGRRHSGGRNDTRQEPGRHPSQLASLSSRRAPLPVPLDSDDYRSRSRQTVGDSGRLAGFTHCTGPAPASRIERRVQFGAPSVLARRDTLMAQPFDDRTLKLSGDPLPVAEDVANEGGRYTSFTASWNGSIAFVQGARAASRRLTWLDRSGNAIGTIGEPSAFGAVALAPNQRLVAASIAGDNTDVWIVDTARAVTTRLTFDPTSETYPVWSPDSSRVAFMSGEATISQKAVTSRGQQEALIKVNGATLWPSDWSRDGRFIAYTFNTRAQGAAATFDIWILPTTGDRKAFPLMQTPFVEENATFSPDTKWIAYQSTESGVNQIYVQPFPPTGEKYQVSRTGGTQPKWRADGQELFFLGIDNTMISTQISTTKVFEVLSAKTLFTIANLALPLRHAYSPSADGQRFLFALPERRTAQAGITIITNRFDGSKMTDVSCGLAPRSITQSGAEIVAGIMRRMDGSERKHVADMDVTRTADWISGPNRITQTAAS